MPAHRIDAPFSDKQVLSVIRSMKKDGAQKTHIAKQLRAKGFRRIPERAVDRALLRLKDGKFIKAHKRRWYVK